MDDRNNNTDDMIPDEKNVAEDKAHTDEPVPESNAAKLLKIREGKDSLSIDSEEPVKKSFWGNIWYHYKSPILIFISFIIIFAIATGQIMKRDKPDTYILYAGPVYFDSESTKEIESILKSVMSEDYNGDGEKGVQFTNIVYLSEDVIAQRQAEANENGYSLSVNNHANNEEYETFSNEMLSGNSVICLLDPFLYENVKEAEGFLKLSEIFDETPDGAIDEYGIKFSETKICKYYSVFDSLPEDTIFAVRRVSTMSIFKGKEKTEKAHQNHVKFARDIINFEYPEGYSEDDGSQHFSADQ